ncbi:MAG: trigger factor [Aquificae bacterium]|nr:trigger factor [Aquificota bacterium]
METKLTKDKGLYRKLEITLEGNEVAQYLDEIYDYLAHSANIPGFRKGKVPRRVLRKRFKETIERHVANRILEKHLNEALEKEGVKPVADVYLQEVNIDEETPKAVVIVLFEVPPEFEVKNPEEITVEVPKVEFDPKQVENYINQLREQHAQWQTVDREIKEGDLVEVEYEVEDTQSGEKDKGETAGVIGEGVFRKEIEEALKGKKAGDEISLQELPLYDKEGKEIGKVNIRLKVKAVKEKVLPELNDEFAKKLNLGETWEEAKKKIEEQLKEQFERSKEAQKRELLLGKLIEEHKIEVPETLVRRELDQLVEQRVRELQAYGLKPNQINIQQLVNDLTPVAVFNVATRLILDKYAEKFNIEVSDEEVMQELENVAKLSGVDKNALIQQLKENGAYEATLEGIKAELRRRKALEELLKKVKFVEVEPKQEDKKEEQQKEEK